MIEVLNHIHCVKYILDPVTEPLIRKYIRKLHEFLMTGTVDAYRQRVCPGPDTSGASGNGAKMGLEKRVGLWLFT